VITTAALYARPGPLAPSVADQLQELQTFAAQHGWPTREFADGDVASHTSWDACLEALRKRQCRILVVASLDRLGLRLVALLGTVCELVGSGVRLITLGEGVDTSAPEGKAFTECCAILVEYDRALHAERTRAGIRRARERGRRIGNQTCFFDKERATRLRDQGWGQIRIARELGVGVGRVHRWVKEEYRPPELRSVRGGGESAMPLSEGPRGG
jgi:DNA invertase Pin-like site-specific DNA recombinase